MMENPIPPRMLRPRRRRRRLLIRVLLGVLLVSAVVVGGAIYRLSRPFVTPGTGIVNQVREIRTAAMDPRDAFPGKHRLYVLGLGIDANYTSRGIMYTKNARSDTIFVVSLDLENQRVGMLSIPRDTRVRIPHGHGIDKINAAHAYGEVPLAKATVEQFLGVQIDHYIVIKMHGTKNMVDALGGVDIDVEKDMDYDDNWGNLHIHLKKGPQHLNGEQAVGYARFRHDNESDFGRMRRQQQLVKAVAKQLMTPSTLLKLDKLVDTAMDNVITDLSRSQLLALAHLFYKTPQERIFTGTIPGTDYRADNGVWYLDPSESRKEALVGWILRGEEWYRNGLITVRVHNSSGVNGAATTTRDILADQGYRAIVGRSHRATGETATRVVDVTGKTDAAQEIARLFADAWVDRPNDDEKPQIGGPDILVYVGKAWAERIKGSSRSAGSGSSSRRRRLHAER